MNEDFSQDQPLTVGALMRGMCAPDYPSHIVRLLKQVQSWLPKTYRVDGIDMPYWEAMRDAPDIFFSELEWLEQRVALLPALTPPPPQPEAVVLTLGEVDLTGAMRLSVDYSLIFSNKLCRRVWIVTDMWIPCDVIEYSDHIRAMTAGGISLRFMLVTPWGWLEIPVSSLGSRQLPGSSAPDGGRGCGRRRDDD